MTTHADGSRITIHFQGKLSDGELFEKTQKNKPLSVCLGNHEIFEKLEAALKTMAINETRTIYVLPEEGFGAYSEDRILTLARGSLPPAGSIRPGQEIILRTPEGEELPAIVLDTGKDSITVDANHPLAGEELEYTITVVDVIPPETPSQDFAVPKHPERDIC